MRWFGVIAHEVFALFVDDGSFAVAILAWLAFAGLVPPRLGVTPVWQGVGLFVGLATVLVASVCQRARSKAPLR